MYSGFVTLLLFSLSLVTIAAGGRIVGYLPGYKPTDIPPMDLVNAGYTHVIVAFATFNASQPGALVIDFPYITPQKVQALKQAGLKVLISLGGALTNTPGATVNFHQISTISNFTAKFVASIEQLVKIYAFDGVDFDIETGFTNDGSPSDVDNLAAVIKLLHQNNPNMLISLVPQAANISPAQTRGTWIGIYGSYSNLAMQTYQCLTWSGIQIYNTGGMNGINDQEYSNMDPKNVDFSVAMAVDMLENWPSKQPNGQPSGFPPYKSFLRDDQVLLGYPAPNAEGNSDGGPNKPNIAIKQIIKCLRGGYADHSLCADYYPPYRNYPKIGGVFNWEITYDQNNHFKFASELKDCIKANQC
jgi:chitinase